jgi:hypothetical protein
MDGGASDCISLTRPRPDGFVGRGARNRFWHKTIAQGTCVTDWSGPDRCTAIRRLLPVDTLGVGEFIGGVDFVVSAVSGAARPASTEVPVLAGMTVAAVAG